MSASRKLKGTWLLVAGLVLLLTISLSRQGFADSCFYEDFSKYAGWDERPTTGDDYAFAIYCSGPNITDLPAYWSNAWGPYGYSIEGFFITMSDSAYRLHCDPYKYGDRPFYHPDLEPEEGVCNSGVDGFADSILKIADDYIDYANYDHDNSDTVDGFFFVIISSSSETGGCDHVDCMYTSSDTNANGNYVVVNGYYGVEIRIQRDQWGQYTRGSWFKQFCVHLWGHQFGLTDLYGGHTVGGFSAMTNWQFPWYPPWPPGGRCSPYDPHSRIKLGWVTPTVVSGTLSDQPILDHLSTNQVYKLFSSGYSDAHFLVSNHTKDSYWEAEYPGGGLLIWHITPGGKNYVADTIPEVDVEGADGLWDFGQVPPVRNDSIGQDSIDCCGPGFYHNFWNNNTKTCFDDTSSPNTRNYIMDGSLVKQTIYTGVWVRDIQGDPGDDTLFADLFSPVEVWGPGTITFTGDITIDSGYTVKVLPYTYIKFDTTDDQSSGYDANRCELIVKGKLIAKGTQYEPPGPKNIHFKSILDTLGQAGDWYGIVVDTGGVVDIYEVLVKDACSGIQFVNRAGSGSGVVRSTFRDHVDHGIKSRIADVEIKHNRVTGLSAGEGIYVEATGANVKLNQVDSSKIGIHLKGVNGGSTTMFMNEVYGPGDLGIILEDVLLDLQNPTATRLSQNKINGIFSECHLLLDNARHVRVDTCELLTGEAIDTTARSPIGIDAENCDSVVVRKTKIRGYSAFGFRGDGQTTANLGIKETDLGNNYIATEYVPASGRVYAVENARKGDMKAEMNYWGTADPPDTMFSGDVDYDPWLEFAPLKPLVSDGQKHPQQISLSQNYPNPFNPNTVIRFSLPETSRTSVRIYNILGRLVRTVVEENLPAGEHVVMWDGANQAGEQVASGIYFCVLKAGDLQAAKKMVLLR